MALAQRWIVVADGRRARAYQQLRPGATLEQVETYNMTEDEAQRAHPSDRPARAHDSLGPGRHSMDQGVSLHEEAEERFLVRLAKHLAAARKADRYSQLVLFAPPRALGRLRAALGADMKDALETSIDVDVVDETPAQLSDRLSKAGLH